MDKTQVLLKCKGEFSACSGNTVHERVYSQDYPHHDGRIVAPRRKSRVRIFACMECGAARTRRTELYA